MLPLYYQFLLFRCREENQFEEYERLIRKLYRASEDQIFNQTGCLSKCDKFEYTVQSITELTKSEPRDKVPWDKNTLRLAFYFTTGKYELKKQVKLSRNSEKIYQDKHILLQYIIYVFNDWIADVGGYLGLLLGQSIFGLVFGPLDYFLRDRKSLRALIWSV